MEISQYGAEASGLGKAPARYRILRLLLLLLLVVEYAAPPLATQNHMSQEGGAMPQPPATQSRCVVSQKKLWTQIYDLLLDLDACLTPEAQNWTDLNCRP